MSISPANNTALNTLFNPLASSTKTAETANRGHDNSSNMEEISMKFSESVERNSKSLEERSIKPRTKMRAEKLEALYHLLAEQGNNLDDEVRRVLARGQQNQQNLSMDAFLSAANGDPTKADVLVQHAFHRAKASGDQTLLNTLQGISQELNEHHGQDILAGINTAEALAMYTQDPQQRDNMRNLYYRNIVGQGSLSAIFDTLLSQFDEKHFSQGIHTLMRALSDDLSSQFPSKPASHLKALLKDLSASQNLNNILNRSSDLLKRLSIQTPIQGDITAARLTRRLIDFTQANLYPREVKSLGNDIVGHDPSLNAKFYNMLYPLMKDMPRPLWKDDGARAGALQTTLRVMTEYTQLERQQQSATAQTTPPQT